MTGQPANCAALVRNLSIIKILRRQSKANTGPQVADDADPERDAFVDFLAIKGRLDSLNIVSAATDGQLTKGVADTPPRPRFATKLSRSCKAASAFGCS